MITHPRPPPHLMNMINLSHHNLMYQLLPNHCLIRWTLDRKVSKYLPLIAISGVRLSSSSYSSSSFSSSSSADIHPDQTLIYYLIGMLIFHYEYVNIYVSELVTVQVWPTIYDQLIGVIIM